MRLGTIEQGNARLPLVDLKMSLRSLVRSAGSAPYAHVIAKFTAWIGDQKRGKVSTALKRGRLERPEPPVPTAKSLPDGRYPQFNLPTPVISGNQWALYETRVHRVDAADAGVGFRVPAKG